jgi:uncharacterized protein (DUF1697 family)
MQTYIALLRGINVSGQKQIKMADLKALFVDTGGLEVQTYIQSGNVVFRHTSTDPGELGKAIEQQIRGKYAFEVPVLIRTDQQMQLVLDMNPFLKEGGVDKEQLYVTFLEKEPLVALTEKIQSLQFEPDQFVGAGTEVYVYCPGGYGRTKINNTFFENKLKVKATTRNLRTLSKLIQMTDAIQK